MKQDHIQGICAIDKPDFALLRDLGVRYVRLGLAFPFDDAGRGTFSAKFENSLRNIEKYAAEGFKTMGVTPGPGSYRYDPETKQMRWVRWMPEWAGPHDGEFYYETLGHACEAMAERSRGMVDLWQISNEPDNDIFRAELTDEQMDRFLLTSARAIKRVTPQSRNGINIAVLTDSARRMLRSIYSPNDKPFDYIGIDGYFGSWEAGSPANWIPYIDEVHQLTGRPVIINEWGYSSLQSGPITDDPERTKPYSQDVCRTKSWKHVWRTAHSPEEQADFMRECLRIFAGTSALYWQLHFPLERHGDLLAMRPARMPGRDGVGHRRRGQSSQTRLPCPKAGNRRTVWRIAAVSTPSDRDRFFGLASVNERLTHRRKSLAQTSLSPHSQPITLQWSRAGGD